FCPLTVLNRSWGILGDSTGSAPPLPLRPAPERGLWSFATYLGPCRTLWPAWKPPAWCSWTRCGGGKERDGGFAVGSECALYRPCDDEAQAHEFAVRRRGVAKE